MTQAPPTLPDLLAEARAAQMAGARDRAARLYRQVVRLRPDHAGAWLARIELALSLNQTRRALRQCDAALALCPGHRAVLLTKRARALEARGRRAEALEILEPVCAGAPDDLPAQAVLAGMRHRAGDLGGADAAYARVLELKPDHAGAWMARSEIALVQGAPGRALDLAEAALPLCPAQAVPLGIKRVRALDALGQAGAALAQIAPLRETAPGNRHLQLLEAGLLRKTGDLALAEAAYAAALAEDPSHPGAWLGWIDVAQTAGDSDRALALAGEARAALPGETVLIARQAGLQLQMGQTSAAIATLEAALDSHPDSPRLLLELARARMMAGDAGAAEAQFAACLAADPGASAARLGLAEAAGAQGDPAAGLAALAGHEDQSPALGLKAAELMLQAGRLDDLRPLLDRLAGTAPRMAEHELLRLFRLGEQGDHLDAALAVIATVAGRSRISPLIARFLMTRARVIVPADRVAAVAAALEHRQPPARAAEFRVFAAALLQGPESGFACARTELGPTRDTQGAAVLGERMLDAGHARLGFRYLRACVRRWPNARHLRDLFLRAAIETGRLTEAHGWLDRLEARFPDLDLGLDRMQILTQQGRLAEAFAMAEAREAAGLRTLSPRRFLELALALGDLEKSTELADRVRREPGAGRQNAAHFSTTLHGQRFNELRLYTAARAAARAAGETPDAAEARLAGDFFFPARRRIADRIGDFGPRPGAVTVPRRIFQYWHSPDLPAEVDALMQSWRDAEGFEHRLFDRRQGLDFLRTQFGPRHVRAFRLAGSPAEECDFLRLCLLYKLGGIYADADDRLTGDAAQLIAQGPGLILVSEPWRAIANNVICAPPEHPLLLWALRTAGRSLLARENDGIWFKTGPGLMTRAVADWLEQTPPETAAEGLTILSQGQLAGFVQPHVRLSYKTSGNYWNAANRHAPAPVIAALTALGG